MDELVRDLRVGIRMLVKRPLFTAVAVSSLALAIGANTAIFSLMDAVLLRPWQVADPGRLVAISVTDAGGGGAESVSYPAYQDFRGLDEAFSGVVAFSSTDLSVSGGGTAELVTGELVSENYFSVLGVPPLRGRVLSPEDGRRPVAVVGQELWRRLFAGRSDVLDATIRINGATFTVVGVAPPGFKGLKLASPAELWLPLESQPLVATGFLAQLDVLNLRGIRWLEAVARLRDGVAVGTAEAALRGLGERLARSYPDSDAGLRFALEPATRTAVDVDRRRDVVGFVEMLVAVVALQLLIACANVGGLLLARGRGRRREAAIRMAIGASRGRFVRQVVTEGVLLSLLGGAAGLAVAHGAIRLLAAYELPAAISIETLDLGLNLGVLAATFVLSLATGVLFSLPLAWQMSSTDCAAALGDRDPEGRGRFGLRGSLVVAEVGLTLLLLIGAGLFARSLRSGLAADPGFATAKVLRLSVDLGLQGYDEARARRFYDEVVQRVAALPGVAAASWTKSVPLGARGMSSTVEVEGYQPRAGEDMQIEFNTVGPAYFSTLAIPLLHGDGFTRRDDEGGPGEVIVNERAARRFWPSADPLGRRISTGGADGPFYTVVGVVRDGKVRSLWEESRPRFYFPIDPYFGLVGLTRMTLLVRTEGDPLAASGSIRHEIERLDADLPVTEVMSLQAQVAELMTAQRMGAALLGFFGLVGLTLAVAGVYGITAFVVSQRRREIGIRMALGAERHDVLGMLLRRSALLVGGGLVLGLIAALASLGAVSRFLYGVSPTDPLTLAGAALLLAGVALLASYVPARKASRIPPATAIRHD